MSTSVSFRVVTLVVPGSKAQPKPSPKPPFFLENEMIEVISLGGLVLLFFFVFGRGKKCWIFYMLHVWFRIMNLSIKFLNKLISTHLNRHNCRGQLASSKFPPKQKNPLKTCWSESSFGEKTVETGCFHRKKPLIWMFPNSGTPPNHPILIGLFHYKPSILEVPLSLETSISIDFTA